MHALFKNLVILIRARPPARDARPSTHRRPSRRDAPRARVATRVLRRTVCARAHATRHPPPATVATREPRPLERLRSSRCPGRDWRNTPPPPPQRRRRGFGHPMTPTRPIAIAIPRSGDTPLATPRRVARDTPRRSISIATRPSYFYTPSPRTSRIHDDHDVRRVRHVHALEPTPRVVHAHRRAQRIDAHRRSRERQDDVRARRSGRHRSRRGFWMRQVHVHAPHDELVRRQGDAARGWQPGLEHVDFGHHHGVVPRRLSLE